LSLKSSAVRRPLADPLTAIFCAALETPGATARGLREAAFRGDALPHPLGDYVRKVRSEACRITADDLKRLAAAGHSEDAVFEITIAAALGAAAERMQAGLRELGGD
jgi:hypothetical protein